MIIELILLAGMILFVAGMIKGFSGFATALFAVPLMAFFLDIKFIVPVFAFIDLVGNGYLIVQNRKHIHKKNIIFLLVGILIGSLIGTLFLISLASIILKRILGIIVVIFAVKIFFEKQKLKKIRNMWGVVAGFFGGIFSAMFSTGGPPVVTYLVYKLKSKDLLRATIGGVFFINAIWRIILLAYGQIITTEILEFSLYIIPFLIIGMILGRKISIKVDFVLFKKILAIILIVVGILLIIR